MTWQKNNGRHLTWRARDMASTIFQLPFSKRSYFQYSIEFSRARLSVYSRSSQTQSRRLGRIKRYNGTPGRGGGKRKSKVPGNRTGLRGGGNKRYVPSREVMTEKTSFGAPRASCFCSVPLLPCGGGRNAIVM